MYLNYFLDKAKQVLQAKSETMLAHKIGLNPQELYRARKTGWIKTDALTRAARALGVPTALLIAAKEADATADPYEKRHWHEIMQHALAKDGATPAIADEINALRDAWISREPTEAELAAIREIEEMEEADEWGSEPVPTTIYRKTLPAVLVAMTLGLLYTATDTETANALMSLAIVPKLFITGNKVKSKNQPRNNVQLVVYNEFCLNSKPPPYQLIPNGSCC